MKSEARVEAPIRCVVCDLPQMNSADYGKHLNTAHGLCYDCSIGESEQCVEKCKERGLFEPQKQTVATDDTVEQLEPSCAGLNAAAMAYRHARADGRTEGESLVSAITAYLKEPTP